MACPLQGGKDKRMKLSLLEKRRCSAGFFLCFFYFCFNL